jgi:hypothetical protein
MLDYNLEALVGPRYSELHAASRIQRSTSSTFNLLRDILQLFLNLTCCGGWEESDVLRRTLKTDAEIAKPLEKVEIKKESPEAEDVGEVPDEFFGTVSSFRGAGLCSPVLLDPIMPTIMEDPHSAIVKDCDSQIHDQVTFALGF